MDIFRWDVTLTVLGVVVPIFAALYEFVFVGRKRLGYRVQMDTVASDEVHSSYAGALQRLERDGGDPLLDPSFVLLRFENNGATHIDESDYAVLDDDRVGIRVAFPGRRVAGLVVTELSHEYLRPSFEGDSGLHVRDGVIQLPRVPMNRGTHYKVLAALEREEGETRAPGTEFAPPRVIGGIKGGVGSGDIPETRSRTGISLPTVALVCFLVVIIVTQLGISLSADDENAPLDCASGELTLTGSTAFAPVLDEAADSYESSCPDAEITVAAGGSAQGLTQLDRAGREHPDGRPPMLAFSDGAKDDGHPQLLPRPIAFSLFTLVINEDAGVLDLTPEQLRAVFDGRLTNWTELGGNDVPIRLVGRHDDSGTRRVFQRQVLDGDREPASTSDNCRDRDPGADDPVIRCERGSTDDLLDAVAATPGAIGYAELGAALERDELPRARIAGHEASLEAADHDAYPFWETELAYTYGELPADSLAASFLRYLTNQVGQDLIRAHGHRPCAELQNPVLCRPLTDD
ncbi:phosphate ABC transporter substrate-binding protein [Streptomyces sp. 3MP-14]|uniref:Phosphate ABC transporter substrate-binding protein n=1 Tax=Streptomyces mimosae TaxID=2586635 RepID=A0A5N6AKI6_9ACTN|nr:MULTISPECIES: substrate-binding domain-containing protein [Streptomyces]KAB8168715.1 phosphate ABC transporter substrate-binding protein [Streptomyces mimosae]KAB8178005.1 phosphate ABC transporter substrate-binding protein [Streptomyces sp. 3MP-14]